MSETEYRGTITDKDDFDAEMAGRKFYKAMKGMGTDERIIIELLTTHSSLQRAEIEETYKSMYGRDLIEDLKDELGGHFEATVVALLTSPYDMLVTALNDCFKGVGTDEKTLIDILCCRNADEIESLRWWYESKFSRALDDDLQSDLSGQFKYLMRGLVAAGRDEDPTKDASRARKDAQDLYDAGIGMNNGTDEAEFIRILNLRSFPQLQETFEAYERIAADPIENAIRKEFNGDMAKGLLAIIQRVNDPLGFYCERLKQSMAGAGTDDKTLIRILVCRSEIDLFNIMLRYKEMYKKELVDDIKDDTNGDYGKLLIAICKPSVPRT